MYHPLNCLHTIEAAELVGLQLRLACWQYEWDSIRQDNEKRASLIREAQE